jgi:hypothetical protein
MESKTLTGLLEEAAAHFEDLGTVFGLPDIQFFMGASSISDVDRQQIIRFFNTHPRFVSVAIGGGMWKPLGNTPIRRNPIRHR